MHVQYTLVCAVCVLLTVCEYMPGLGTRASSLILVKCSTACPIAALETPCHCGPSSPAFMAFKSSTTALPTSFSTLPLRYHLRLRTTVVSPGTGFGFVRHASVAAEMLLSPVRACKTLVPRPLAFTCTERALAMTDSSESRMPRVLRVAAELTASAMAL